MKIVVAAMTGIGLVSKQKLSIRKDAAMKEKALSYGDLVEQWKVELIVQRARHFGIPEHDWADIQQSIILEILNFKYDPENAQGAEERTALTSLIDNRIIDLLRRQTNQEERHEEYLRDNGFTNPQEESLSYSQNNALHCDIKAAIAALSENEKAVCAGLMEGLSIRQIAHKLHCRRESIGHMIQNIRGVFKELGVHKWLQ
ncbi:MAG TPA: sigma-70 family RNA polymerase sigma factor [Anaerohalosphaeraceae bacterium]|nr:sigma-70 family RNA polymerase sigma factor [Anaerohalosphaeraceae bacterium]